MKRHDGRSGGRAAPAASETERPAPLRLAALACAVMFTLLTLDALLRPHAVFDPWLLRAVQRIEPPLLEAIIRPVDWLTDGPGAVLIWSLVLCALVLMHRWPPALVVLTLPVGGAVNFVVGRYLVDRDRPDPAAFARVIVDTGGPAYPSGHVMGAVMLYGFLFLLAGRIRPRYPRLAARTACVAVVAICGFARIWYGAHWPSDVLGGYALGGLLLVAMIAIYRRLVATQDARPRVPATLDPAQA